MKRFARQRTPVAAALLVVVLVTIANAQTSQQEAAKVADGVYEFTNASEGKTLTLADGREAKLGKLLTADLGSVEIASQNNENTEFWLRLTGVRGIDKESNPGQLLIVASGHAFTVSSHGSRQESPLIDLGATISDVKIADQVAKATNARFLLRQHPGHKIATTWTPLKESFAPGEDVLLQLAITNVGETPVRFFVGGQQRGARDNQFRFIARAAAGYGAAIADTGDANNFGGLAFMQEIAPSETFTIEINLNGWFKLSEPDTYQITGLYEVELYAADDQTHPIWRDFAAGDCKVVIKAADDNAP